MSDDDNWVKSAMDDSDLVAQLLLKLRQAPSAPSPSPSHLSQLPIGWSIRQRRSRPPAVVQPAAGKKSPAARASPTTPLSWSGATTSVSGGGGGEESSRPTNNRSDTSRSKVIRPNETAPTKRPRKKKTLAELREDETVLLKERKQLKRQLETLQAACQEQRKENENLKKMKMDVTSQGLKPKAAASIEPHQAVVASVVINGMEAMKDEEFVVPDLNIPAGRGDE